MRVLIDTSIFFPAVTQAHPLHEPANALLNDCLKAGKVLILNTHLIAELYSNMTRYPPDKVHPHVAANLIHTFAKNLDLVALDTKDYLEAVDRCASRELISGVIFDALHVQAAIKGKADVLYTANTKDFERLMSDELKFELKSLSR